MIGSRLSFAWITIVRLRSLREFGVHGSVVFFYSAAAAPKLAILIDIDIIINAASNGDLFVIYLLLSEAMEPEFIVNL